MKKKFLRLTLMGIALMFMGMSAQAQNYSYVKVTSAPSDWSGEYLIVYEGDSTHDPYAFDGALTSLDAAKNGVAVTITDGVIVGSDAINAATFTISKIDDTNYRIQSASGYYIGVTSNSNGLKSSNEATDKDKYKHLISLDASNNIDIKSNFDGSTMYLRYNYASDNLRFRYYKNQGQKAIALYKKVVPMTITTATWASFSSASEVAIPTGVTAYYAIANTESSVTLKEITDIIPANEGVVINGTAGTYYAALSSTSTANISGNLLKPWTTAGTPSDATYYTLAVSGTDPIFKKSAGGTLAAGKSYLVLSGSGARELGVDFGNETAINALENSNKVNDGAIYDLSGRRVENPTKGIYIMNGKKFVIK